MRRGRSRRTSPSRRSFAERLADIDHLRSRHWEPITSCHARPTTRMLLTIKLVTQTSKTRFRTTWRLSGQKCMRGHSRRETSSFGTLASFMARRRRSRSGFHRALSRAVRPSLCLLQNACRIQKAKCWAGRALCWASKTLGRASKMSAVGRFWDEGKLAISAARHGLSRETRGEED
jgi:hypothetical protein